jgi:hypothetical protein
MRATSQLEGLSAVQEIALSPSAQLAVAIHSEGPGSPGRMKQREGAQVSS